jgi:hypothetical protein
VQPQLAGVAVVNLPHVDQALAVGRERHAGVSLAVMGHLADVDRRLRPRRHAEHDTQDGKHLHYVHYDAEAGAPLTVWVGFNLPSGTLFEVRTAGQVEGLPPTYRSCSECTAANTAKKHEICR